MAGYFYLFQIHRWIFTIAVAVICFIIGQFATPYCKGFHWTDQTINMPMVAQEIFPNWSLVPIVGCPMVFYAVVVFFLPRKRFMFPPMADVSPKMQLLLEVNSWAIIQIQALMLQVMFVETMKLYGGRLRPDFLARLASVGVVPDGSTSLQYFCDLSSRVVREGRLSFPSGHSSTSFGAMVPLTFFLVYHLRPWFYGCIIRLALSITPLYLALFVAVSRTRDNRHNFADILAGSVIGLFAGIGAFWINLKHRPTGHFEARPYVEVEEGMIALPTMSPAPQQQPMVVIASASGSPA